MLSGTLTSLPPPCSGCFSDRHCLSAEEAAPYDTILWMSIMITILLVMKNLLSILWPYHDHQVQEPLGSLLRCRQSSSVSPHCWRRQASSSPLWSRFFIWHLQCESSFNCTNNHLHTIISIIVSSLLEISSVILIPVRSFVLVFTPLYFYLRFVFQSWVSFNHLNHHPVNTNSKQYPYLSCAPVDIIKS